MGIWSSGGQSGFLLMTGEAVPKSVAGGLYIPWLVLETLLSESGGSLEQLRLEIAN